MAVIIKLLTVTLYLFKNNIILIIFSTYKINKILNLHMLGI